MSTTNQVITIMIVVLGTMATRFTPFFIFPEAKEPPKVIKYLGNVLPYAVMGLLVVYCLKDVMYSDYYGLHEGLAILAIILLHRWKRNMFLSIVGGTIFYMVIIRIIV